jgi:serine/threonine protein kinase
MDFQHKRHTIVTGLIINNYKILEFLGVGGFGATYLAQDLTTNSPVAIKVINKDKSRSLFRSKKEDIYTEEEDTRRRELIGLQEIDDEIQTLIELTQESKSKYIAKYYDNFDDLTYKFIVMEYVSKTNFYTFIKQNKANLTRDIVWPMMLQLITGLKHIHAMGYAHRDIKGDNILITKDYTIKYIDFGVSCLNECKVKDCSNECFRYRMIEDSDEQKLKPLAYYEENSLKYLKEDQIKDVQDLINLLFELLYGYHTPEIYYRNVVVENSKENLNPDFDDGRTSTFLENIHKRGYDINKVFDLFLSDVLEPIL